MYQTTNEGIREIKINLLKQTSLGELEARISRAREQGKQDELAEQVLTQTYMQCIGGKNE